MARSKRNRKLNARAPSKSPLGCLAAAAGVCVVYLSLSCQCDRLSKDIHKLEREKEDLSRAFQNAEYRWSNLRAPHSLATALAKHDLRMDWPRADQIVWLKRSTPERPPSPRTESMKYARARSPNSYE